MSYFFSSWSWFKPTQTTKPKAALQSFSRVKDPLLRRVLELRFGADQGGERRSPAEVAEVLGGKYAGKAETALMLIRQALRSLRC